MHTGFWWGNLREIAYLEDQSIDGRIKDGSSESGVDGRGLD